MSAGWGFTDRPAVTVGNAVGRGLIGGTGAKAAILQAIDDGSFIPSWNGDASCFAEITRITVAEAALLQGYPRFIIKGEDTGMKAVDLFSGTGWGVACQWLGIDEIGVDSMPEVRATREANGMVNWVDDVWKVLEDDHDDNPALTAELSIASPPCQTFSMAGSGSGRKALDQVYEAIRLRAYRDPARLRELGEQTDPRTALVLTPMCYAYLFRPKFIVWEQVPQVLPVWEACAELLRKGGYSVVTGILHAEQYGVPQTRKRAILIARSDGIEAKMPRPTHSRYYSRDPKKFDAGVLPWVSMAEALGWGMTEKPYPTVASGTEAGGGTDPAALGGSGARKIVRGEREAGRWEPGSPYNEGAPLDFQPEPGAKYFHPMTYGRRGIWPGDQPAPTIRGVQREMPEGYEPHPRDAVVMRSNYGTGGDPAARGERDLEEPAATVASKAGRNMWVGNQVPGGSEAGDYQTRSDEFPAPTVTSGSKSAKWAESPAPAIAADPRVAPRGCKHPQPGCCSVWPVGTDRKPGLQFPEGTTRVTIDEAAALQSFPHEFDWATGPNGKPLTKTKAFLQIGNAVPPLLAHAILKELLS